MFNFFKKKNTTNSINPRAHGFIVDSKKIGDDTSIPRPVDFLFIGEKDNLDQVLKQLTSKGFKQIESNYSEPEKSIMVSKTMNIDSFITNDVITHLESVADKYSVLFDGWETSPVTTSQDRTA